MRGAVALASAVLVLLAGVPAIAGSGAGELALDRGALASLIAAATPGPRALAMPGLGKVTVELIPPRVVRFVRGGVEFDLGLRLPQAKLEGQIAMRMVPEIRENDGTVLLRTARATGLGPLAMFPDLASLMPPIELPRTHDTVVQPKGGRRTQIVLSTQKVEIQEERLVLLFGMTTKELPKDAPAAPPAAAAPKASAR